MTTLSMTGTPINAECRCVLAGGRVLTITASRRPRANRADVKCTVAGAPAIAERMQEVVRLARHTEVRFDSRDQVVLSMDIIPATGERDWELAAVMADRAVRGLYQQATATKLYAHGWSDAWHLGRVDGDPARAMTRARPHLDAAASVILGAAARPHAPGPQDPGAPTNAAFTGNGAQASGADGAASAPAATLQISHLGALDGHADPSSSVSTVRAWFPLHSGGINDTLDWVEVSVFPLDGPQLASDVSPMGQSANATHIATDGGADSAEEDAIAAPGLDLSAQQEVRQTLAGARHFDGKGLGRWRSVVRFGQPRFQGGSYQLALVMADRLARGREFVPRGRIIATGCSSAWHAGLVDTVEGREPKLDLILRQAVAGDRVLLPKAWQDHLGEGFAAALRQRGASLACIDRIGMI